MAVRKLLVACQKGGVGKTTTSMNLAAAAAMAGTRVLLLDADPLSSISTSLNLSQHVGRQSLRKLGVELPGVLVASTPWRGANPSRGHRGRNEDSRPGARW
jgi:cellulose biosynthesis protein BcsQ